MKSRFGVMLVILSGASAKAVSEMASGQESLAQMLYYLTHLSRQIVLV